MTRDPKIGVYHPNLMNKGGAEAVCMHLLDELCDSYEVHLITHKQPKINVLNDYFSTQVSDISVEIPGQLTTPLNVIAHITDSVLSVNLGVVRASYLERCVREKQQNYDLIISTLNERSFSTFSIQYVHYPRESVIEGSSLLARIHEQLNKTISGRVQNDIEDNLLICNSEWTYNKLSDHYTVDKKVIHPPVLTEEFKSKDWGKKDDGILSIGRIEPSKNLVENIEIVDGVHRRGHDIHLHIIGPVLDSNYYQKIKRMADSRKYIKIHREISRSELVRMIRDHKYGLHGKPAEHFGIVVAEMVAGGILPFVRNEGGQTNIVNEHEGLIYEDVDDGVNKIVDIITDPDKQKQVTNAMPDIEKEFGVDRFQTEIREIIKENI